MAKKIDKYKYNIDFRATSPNFKETMPLSSLVNDITVIREFDTDMVFPIIQANLYVNSRILKQIQMNVDNIKFILTIKKTKVTDINNDKVSTEYVVRNKILRAYDIDKEPVKEMNEETMSKEAYQIPITLNMFLDEHIGLTKNIITGVLSNTNIEKTISYIFDQVINTDDKFIFDIPDNKKRYDQIIIPSLNLVQSIKYINKVFGIYNSGMKLFFDLNNYYLLGKKNLKSKTAMEMEWRNVLIELMNPNKGELMGTEGCFEDRQNKRYYVKKTNNVVINTRDSSIRELGGELIKILSRNDRNKYITRGINNTNLGSNDNRNFKQRLLWNNYNNEYAEKEFTFNMERSMNTLLLNFRDMNIDIFNINRRFEFSFEERDYRTFNGNYSMYSQVSSYTKSDRSSIFTLRGSCRFQKI